MKRLTQGCGVAALLVAIGLLLPAPAVIGQGVARLYGTISGGTPVPIGADSSGSMLVSLSGGGASTSDISTDSTHGFCFSSRGCIKAAADGLFTFTNNAATGADAIILGPSGAGSVRLRKV